MTPETFEKLYPVVDSWIQSTLAAHAGKSEQSPRADFRAYSTTSGARP